ncbi:Transmembrane protein [Phytophthora megakarya]|uniref:Transmembrane protein n=1 Tax=Phytophthora megakarya TaxID=4795 RepID=A0A225UWS9_9STRA|nr:Transmembrane protein [Phytophthora megakarya]
MPLQSKGVTHPTYYSLVPAQPLPLVDLSKSLRGRLLPPKIHTYIRRKYLKHYRSIILAAVASYCLNVSVPLVEARMGRTIAVLAAILWIPIGLGSVTTLRYDIVRLVSRTFDFWFFSTITTIITITMSMYLGDLRSVRMLIDWIGYHHVVFVDAHVLGLKSLTFFLLATIFSVTVVFVWIILGKVDGGSTFTIVKYQNRHRSFELSGIDVIGNCVVSLGFLLAKIVFRRRKILRVKTKRSSAIVEYVITCENSETKTSSCWVTCGGLILSQIPLIHGPGRSEGIADSEKLELVVCCIGLSCTAIFTSFFVVFYQRQLLKLLFTSFDFAFYSFQVTVTDVGVCILYSWDIARCLMVLSWWFWAQWVFTLDALTPSTRYMLKLRIRFAAPVLCILLLDHLVIIYRIFFNSETL